MSRVLAVVGAVLSLGACGSDNRLPAVPLALADRSNPLDIPDLRFYPDADGEKLKALAVLAYERAKSHGRGVSSTAHFLAISGGGDDGAFGAGILCGWSERGDRPEFVVVTGISTGALSAPFAFLGPSYDTQLKRVYTDTAAQDIFSERSVLAAVSEDGMVDTAPLRAMIASYVDSTLIGRIAEEYRKGRLLLIMSTNLDQGRPVIWNIGAIAASDHPRARDLIIDIMRASAAIPGVFPPVMIDVTIDGERYQEMHVDGGAIAQAFLYPPGMNLKALSKELRAKRQRVAYIIRNGRFHRPEENVKRQTLAIAMQAISTMTATAGVNDTYRIYMTTSRDGVDYNLAHIGEDFTDPYKGPFDKEYMRSLFSYGYAKGKEGYSWRKKPPGYAD